MWQQQHDFTSPVHNNTDVTEEQDPHAACDWPGSWVTCISLWLSLLAGVVVSVLIV